MALYPGTEDVLSQYKKRSLADTIAKPQGAAMAQQMAQRSTGEASMKAPQMAPPAQAMAPQQGRIDEADPRNWGANTPEQEARKQKAILAYDEQKRMAGMGGAKYSPAQTMDMKPSQQLLTGQQKAAGQKPLVSGEAQKPQAIMAQQQVDQQKGMDSQFGIQQKQPAIDAGFTQKQPQIGMGGLAGRSRAMMADALKRRVTSFQ